MRFLHRTLLFLLVSAITGLAQHRQDQPLTDELYEIEAKRTNLIRSELNESSVDEWAGIYSDNDHHPTVLMLAPMAGFLVTSSSHTFAPSWINFGKAEFRADSIKVFAELDKDNRYAHVMPVEYRKVRWGKQYFLVPSDDLLAFALAVHSRSESEIGSFFSKYSSSRQPRAGLPEVPAEFKKYITMGPIRSRITAIEKSPDPWPIVTISGGHNQKLVEGMIFFYTSRNVDAAFRVTEVSATNSKASVHMFARKGEVEDDNVKVGWMLSSRMPKGFIEPG